MKIKAIFSDHLLSVQVDPLIEGKIYLEYFQWKQAREGSGLYAVLMACYLALPTSTSGRCSALDCTS